MTQFGTKVKKPSFGVLLYRYESPTSCKLLEKNNEPILRKMLKILFLGHFGPNLGKQEIS